MVVMPITEIQPADEYASLAGVSQSFLWPLLTRSPAHAIASRSRKPTAAMRIGTLVDQWVGDPQKLADYMPSWVASRRLNIEQDEYWAAFGAAVSVRHHSAAMRLISSAEKQKILQWEQGGIACKGKPDFVNAELRTLIDLKTTRDASRGAFLRSCWKYGYFFQAAMYKMGLEAIGVPIDNCAIIAVETADPFGVVVYEISAANLAEGRQQVLKALEIYRTCMESGVWRGYEDGVVDL